jgi:hypothetical protein
MKKPVIVTTDAYQKSREREAAEQAYHEHDWA